MRTLSLAALFTAFSIASIGVAQPPDQIARYHVLPRLSTLTESGGFAGVDRPYRVEGDYVFAREWQGGTPREGLKLTARFVESDLRAPLGPQLPAFLDVGELFNLEGLRGELLPQPLAFTPFEVFRFEGLGNDSAAASPLEQSTIELFAVTLGPWMYLHGERTPRPWMADVFAYELETLSYRGRWSDRNDDGIVNAVDYTARRDQATRSPRSIAWGEDHAEWRASFGERVPDLEAFRAAINTALAQQAAAVATPEPGAAVLVLIACLSGAALCRR